MVFAGLIEPTRSYKQTGSSKYLRGYEIVCSGTLKGSIRNLFSRYWKKRVKDHPLTATTVPLPHCFIVPSSTHFYHSSLGRSKKEYIRRYRPRKLKRGFICRSYFNGSVRVKNFNRVDLGCIGKRRRELLLEWAPHLLELGRQLSLRCSTVWL